MTEIDTIRDPVHNYIIINKQEKELIDTVPVQRLRYLKQTPSASFVYPGANHTRFEHSLGVCHLVNKITKSLEDSGDISDSDTQWKIDVQKARIAALLHDVGHGPFSHTFEAFLKMLGVDLDHQIITQLIIKECLADKIKDIFDYSDEDVQDISRMAVGDIAAVGDNAPRLYLAPMVGSQIDADKIDFLQRDALHTGTVEYGSIDAERLILNFKLVDNNGIKRIGIKDRAAFAIEALFLSRYHMYRAVYYHRTTRSFDLMLCDAMKIAAKKIEGLNRFKEGFDIKKLGSDEKKNFLSEYLHMDDYSIMSELRKLAKKNNEIHEIMHKIANRKHYRNVYSRLIHTGDPLLGRLLLNQENIASIEDGIKARANINKIIHVDVPHEIVMLDHSQITIIDEEGNPKLLEEYIKGETGKEKMPILNSMSWLGGRILILNVFADTGSKEERKKIKNASMDYLEGGKALNI